MVKRGPLAGWEGELVRVKNAAKPVVSIQLLSQSGAAEIDSGDVEPLYPATRVA